MKKNYLVSVNGWSSQFATEEEAMQFAKSCDEESAVKVYNRFGNVIWEN